MGTILACTGQSPDKGGIRNIPIAFQVATLLSAFAHPDYLLFVGSRGFALLPPSSNLKSSGYMLWNGLNVLSPMLARDTNVKPSPKQLLKGAYWDDIRQTDDEEWEGVTY